MKICIGYDIIVFDFCEHYFTQITRETTNNDSRMKS